MENKNTVSYLNSKMWYRFIKIVYLSVLLLCIVGYPVAIFISYSPKLDLDKSFIKCQDGRKIQKTELQENGVHLSSEYIPFDDNNKIKSICFYDFNTIKNGNN